MKKKLSIRPLALILTTGQFVVVGVSLGVTLQRDETLPWYFVSVCMAAFFALTVIRLATEYLADKKEAAEKKELDKFPETVSP